MHTSLVDWLGLLLSAITVILVGLYLRDEQDSDRDRSTT
jgi:hypothetical protein